MSAVEAIRPAGVERSLARAGSAPLGSAPSTVDAARGPVDAHASGDPGLIVRNSPDATGDEEIPLVTSGDDLLSLGALFAARPEYTAADVVEYLRA